MNLSHPNAHLSPEVVQLGLKVVSNAFRRCRIVPRHPSEDEFGCNSFIYGELGSKKFLVYVRITLEDEHEEGAGPIPPLLLDASRLFDAEPHLIRVHMRKVGQGTGFEYFGYEEFIESLLSHVREWNAQLIKPKSFDYYFGILKGRISKIQLQLALADGFNHECRKASIVDLKLFIDGHEPYAGTIDPGALLHSAVRGDVHGIFSCSCGVPECAGVWRGVIVVHHGDFVLWKAYYAKGRKLFLFDKEQYRTEILSKCGEAIRLAKDEPDTFVSPYHNGIKYLEKAYYSATENTE